MAGGKDQVAGEMRERLMPGVEARQLRTSVMTRVFGTPSEPARIGRFTVLKRIGSGGMGTVYAAYDNELDRKVAVKVLRGEVEWHDRVRREPQALARLSHPNVVHVYDVGEQGGELFISMEFIDGPTLAEWVEGQSRSWREILGAYVEAGRGLAAAHTAGIIHRDFKPQNVLVGQDGRVRVLDFGLARGRALPDTHNDRELAPDPAASGALLTPITRSGAVIGTRQYMSPEQHRGEEADERADQFSYCVALYEALYGSRPFAGMTEETLTASVLAGEVEAAPPDSRVPQWLRRVLLKGLCVDRDARHPSMDALLEELGRDPAVFIRKTAMVVGAAMVLGVGGLLWQERGERVAQLEVEKEAETALKEAEQQKKEALEAFVRRRQDALTLAEVERFVLDLDPTNSIARLKHLSSEFEDFASTARMLAADADHRGVASRVIALPDGDVPHGLSPDGRTAIIRNPESGVVSLLDIDTGETRRLGEAGGGMPEAAFSPDGRRVAALRLPEGLQVWDVDTLAANGLGDSPREHQEIQFAGEAGILTFGRHPELHRWFDGRKHVLRGHQEMIVSVAVHPLGTAVATVDSYGQARLWDLETAEPKPLFGAGPVAFAPSGRLAIATAAGDIDVLDLETDEAERYSGREVPVEALVFAPGEERMAAGFGDGQVSVWDRESRDRVDLPVTQDDVESLRFVDEATLGATSQASLTLYDVGGGRPRTLRGHGGVGWWAVREDGAVVTVGREGTMRIWELRPAVTRSLDAHQGPVLRVDYTPDGDFITAGEDGAVRRWTTDAPGELLAEHDDVVTALAAARDGAFVASADAAGRVLLRRLGTQGDATEVAKFDDEVQALAWGADGRLAVAHPDGGLTVFDPEQGGAGQRLELGGLQVQAAHYSTDGQRLFVVGWSADERAYVVVMDGDAQMSRSELRTEGILSVGFSPDDRFVAFSGYDRTVRVFDLREGEERTLGQHAALVHGVCFAPDSRTIASAGEEGMVRLWDVVSGYSRDLSMTDRKLRGIAYKPDGRGFVAVGDETTAFFGRDDVPHDFAKLRAWIDERTDLDVDPDPIDPNKWSSRQ